MRILACNWRCLSHPQAGGSETNLFEQARLWARAGHEVTVLCADPGRAVAPEQDEVVDGVNVRRRGGRFSVYLWAALYLLTHPDDFDCVLDVANGIPFFAPLFTRRPVTLLIHHVHDRQWYAEFPWPVAALGRAVERHLVPRAYRRQPVIAVSPTTRDALLALGFAPERLHVVYNGTALPIADAGAPPAADPFRIVYVGRLKHYKRLDHAIRAVDRLRHRFPAVHLDIAGDGDARPSLARLVEQLGLGAHVTLHGYVDEGQKARLLRSAAVFATPSMHEGWGLSVIEANAHGCPAVAYDVPGLRVAIRDGETGLLAGDEAAFVRSLAEILRDGELRARLSSAALAWAQRFDWRTCAQETLDVLAASTPPSVQPLTAASA